METILFSSVLRNNQKYISNMFEMFESIEKKLGDEYKFKYLIYTNNNEDNTYKLLDEKKKENWKVINVDMDEDFLKKHKVEKAKTKPLIICNLGFLLHTRVFL